MSPEPVHLSDAEWKVMHCVWQKSPATARDVLELLEAETGWAYTTVKTLLGRLVGKGALAARMDGKTSVYEPLVTRKQARRSALRELALKAFGGVGPMMHALVETARLSRKDRAELMRLLKEQDK